MKKQSIIDIMEQRHSVRNYKKVDISEQVLKEIEQYIASIDNPFNEEVKIKLIKQNLNGEGQKLGTYGVIKGASYFLVAACKDKKEGYRALGYLLEQVVLYCTSLKLGTCWLGGTFNKSKFSKVVNLKDDEVIAIVSPLGYEADKNSLIGKIFSQSGKRNDFEKMFFINDFNTPLTKDNALEFGTVLEMVRIAPSAVNKQPWRIVKDKNKYHFYLDGKLKFVQIDIGIAMCHFALAVKELGMNGRFEDSNPEIHTTNEYVLSWVQEV